jgi:hypothetical protein
VTHEDKGFANAEDRTAMTDRELAELRGLQWMESRIPARAALATFVPEGSERDPVIERLHARVGGSRWFPVSGGTRILMPFDNGPYDPTRFSIEEGAWDHEHCDACGENISAMTLCHVTEPLQPYVLLCAQCYALHVRR